MMSVDWFGKVEEVHNRAIHNGFHIRETENREKQSGGICLEL